MADGCPLRSKLTVAPSPLKVTSDPVRSARAGWVRRKTLSAEKKTRPAKEDLHGIAGEALGGGDGGEAERQSFAGYPRDKQGIGLRGVGQRAGVAHHGTIDAPVARGFR